jgi:hypothetical protein
VSGISTEQNKAIRRRSYEAVNQNNLDALDEVIASDVINHSARPGQAPGLEGVKQLFSSLHAAFPDFHIEAGPLGLDGGIRRPRPMLCGSNVATLRTDCH